MLAGELYRPDAEIAANQAATKAWLVRYNAALASPVPERHALLSERLAHVGAGAVIRPPFFCDFGYNIRLGDGVFLNFNCVILDVEASIGDRTQIGPAVQIYAADHPRDATTRADGLEFGRPVRIGSVVTRDVGADHIVIGNPGPAEAPQTVILGQMAMPRRGFAIPRLAAMESAMFARRTISISGPASV
jgi:maltose O-acetyltransferase